MIPYIAFACKDVDKTPMAQIEKLVCQNRTYRCFVYLRRAPTCKGQAASYLSSRKAPVI